MATPQGPHSRTHARSVSPHTSCGSRKTSTPSRREGQCAQGKQAESRERSRTLFTNIARTAAASLLGLRATSTAAPDLVPHRGAGRATRLLIALRAKLLTLVRLFVRAAAIDALIPGTSHGLCGALGSGSRPRRDVGGRRRGQGGTEEQRHEERGELHALSIDHGDARGDPAFIAAPRARDPAHPSGLRVSQR